MHLMVLFTMVGFLQACGQKDEGSSSKSSSGKLPITGDCIDTNNNGICDTDEGNQVVSQSFTDLKNYFEQKSLADGVSNDTVVYHTGSFFGAAPQDNGIKFSAVFCVGSENLFGNDDKCDPNNGIEDLYAAGEYKLVKSSSTSKNTYSLANGIDGSGFTTYVMNQSFDRNAEQYRKMLNKNDNPVRKIVVSNAKIQMNGEIKAQYIEYFFENGSYEGYVVAKSLPVIANPVMVTSGYYNGYGVTGDLVGRLNNLGNKTLQSVQANIHRLQQDYQSGTLSPVVQQQFNFNTYYYNQY